MPYEALKCLEKGKQMKEVLFRGRRADNSEWIEGYFCYYGWTDKKKPYIIHDYASALYAIEIIPETVGQYTGLDDRNGRKIFEGDIIKVYHNGEVLNVSYVYFDNGEYRCELISGCSTDYSESLSGQHEECGLEVIGDIYDDSDLMLGDGE